jgi:plasmid replication initiation protein
VNIQGPFTEKDRKLWAFLVHAVWNELETNRFHELSVRKINQVFRACGGDHSTNWIWDSVKRLVRTTVEWEDINGDERYQGIAVLMSSAMTHKDARLTGMLRFEFPAALIPILKEPRRFARLRTHFLISLSGKYAVSLYELLESAINLKNPVLEIELPKLRQYLKVPDSKLLRYVDLKRFVIEPAVKQINENPEGSGFTVKAEPVKKGRAVAGIRFTLTKTKARIEEEKRLLKSDNPVCEKLPERPLILSDSAFNAARKAAPGYDIQYLAREWRESVEKAQIQKS